MLRIWAFLKQWPLRSCYPGSQSKREEQRRELVAVFLRAFEDGGDEYPIDFDEAWKYAGYGLKANALRKLKSHFRENEDYKIIPSAASGIGRPSHKYMLTNAAFEHFTMCSPKGKVVRDFYLAMKRQYFLMRNGLHKRRHINNLLDESTSFIDEMEDLLVAEYPRMETGCEKRVADALQAQEGGRREVQCSLGRVDLVTGNEIVEVKTITSWKHALGQVLAYRSCFDNYGARIHLFSQGDGQIVDVTAIYRLCEPLGVRVTLTDNSCN